MRRISLRIVPAALLAAFSGGAAAGGFQLLEQNASGLGNAYAGSAAVAENASTIYYNPAGMTRLQAREFSVGLTPIRPSYKFRNEGSSVGGLAGTGNGGDAGDWGFAPNGYLSWALSRDLYLGLGLGAPFGLTTEYDNPWLGAAQAIKFEVKTINLNPSLAYRVNDRVSLGFGVNWQKLDIEYQRLAGLATVAPRLKLSADDSAWGWNAGALFELSPTMRLGVSYRSRIKYGLEGDLSANGAKVTDVRADVKLPDTLIVSVAQDLDARWQMLGDLSWVGWSSIPKVNIVAKASGTLLQTLDTDFRNTWRVALGANYKYSDAVKLKFGLAYDQTPVKNPGHRLVSLPDNNRFWFSLGAQYRTGPAGTLDLGLSYLYLKDSQINNNQSAAGRGTVKGSYDAKAFIAGLQYSQAF